MRVGPVVYALFAAVLHDKVLGEEGDVDDCARRSHCRHAGVRDGIRVRTCTTSNRVKRWVVYDAPWGTVVLCAVECHPCRDCRVVAADQAAGPAREDRPHLPLFFNTRACSLPHLRLACREPASPKPTAAAMTVATATAMTASLHTQSLRRFDTYSAESSWKLRGKASSGDSALMLLSLLLPARNRHSSNSETVKRQTAAVHRPAPRIVCGGCMKRVDVLFPLREAIGRLVMIVMTVD